MAICAEWPLYFYLHRCLGCQLHAQCTACSNLRTRFGTTVDGRPSGEGWVSIPIFFATTSQILEVFATSPLSLCQVGFSSLSEAQRAMKDKDRQHIGDRYVEIFLHQVRPHSSPATAAAASCSMQVGDTVFGQKFARGGRGGGGGDGGSFKHEGGAAGDSVKMNSGDIFKKLSREVCS
jgi:hypothetical protein